jgi:hypothetical protein
MDRRAQQGIKRLLLHQLLEAFCQRRLPTADRTKQIEDLLHLFQTLPGMTEKRHNLTNGLFQTVKFRERRIRSDQSVRKNPAQSFFGTGVHQDRLTDGCSNRSCDDAYMDGSL